MFRSTVVILLSLAVNAYCDCGQKAWGDMETCLKTQQQNTEAANMDKMKACFAKAKCPMPSAPRAGASGASDSHTANTAQGSDFQRPANFGDSKVNFTLIKECGEKIMARGKADLETCVQKTEKTFVLPHFDFAGKGQEQWSRGHGARPGPQSVGGFDSECDHEALRGCFEEEMCTVAKTCFDSAFKGCDVTKTRQAACECARTEIKPKFDQYIADMKSCVGPNNEKVLEKFMKATDTNKIWAKVDEMLCGTWDGNFCPAHKPAGEQSANGPVASQYSRGEAAAPQVRHSASHQ